VVVTFFVAMFPPWVGTRDVFNPPHYDPVFLEREVWFGRMLRFPSEEQRNYWRLRRRSELFKELKGKEVVMHVSLPEIAHLRSALEIAGGDTRRKPM